MTYRFTEACDGCSACAHQCPVGAIAGLRDVRFDVDEELCIDCALCGAICPISAVRDEHDAPTSHVPRDLRPRPVVDAVLCNGCALCLAACPTDCRDRVGEHHRGIAFLAHPERCTACGECARACIKGAITMRQFDLRSYDPTAHRATLQRAIDAGGAQPPGGAQT